MVAITQAQARAIDALVAAIAAWSSDDPGVSDDIDMVVADDGSGSTTLQVTVQGWPLVVTIGAVGVTWHWPPDIADRQRALNNGRALVPDGTCPLCGQRAGRYGPGYHEGKTCPMVLQSPGIDLPWQSDEASSEATQAWRAARQFRQDHPIGPCPCACNTGGSCGGCGHAGCGGR